MLPFVLLALLLAAPLGLVLRGLTRPDQETVGRSDPLGDRLPGGRADCPQCGQRTSVLRWPTALAASGPATWSCGSCGAELRS